MDAVNAATNASKMRRRPQHHERIERVFEAPADVVAREEKLRGREDDDAVEAQADDALEAHERHRRGATRPPQQTRAPGGRTPS